MSSSNLSPSARPWWMTALAVFCFASVPFLAYRDLFVAGPREVEIWFGFELHGSAALLTAPLHWAIFALGAWGFWFQRPWVLPLAAAYELYIAVCHLVWNQVSPNGRGWLAGLVQAVAFSIPAALLLWARRQSMRGR